MSRLESVDTYAWVSFVVCGFYWWLQSTRITNTSSNAFALRNRFPEFLYHVIYSASTIAMNQSCGQNRIERPTQQSRETYSEYYVVEIRCSWFQWWNGLLSRHTEQTTNFHYSGHRSSRKIRRLSRQLSNYRPEHVCYWNVIDWLSGSDQLHDHFWLCLPSQARLWMENMIGCWLTASCRDRSTI